MLKHLAHGSCSSLRAACVAFNMLITACTMVWRCKHGIVGACSLVACIPHAPAPYIWKYQTSMSQWTSASEVWDRLCVCELIMIAVWPVGTPRAFATPRATQRVLRRVTVPTTPEAEPNEPKTSLGTELPCISSSYGLSGG